MDAYFADVIYYQKTEPQEIARDTLGKNNDSNTKPLKLKVWNGIKATKDKPTLLLDSVA